MAAGRSSGRWLIPGAPTAPSAPSTATSRCSRSGPRSTPRRARPAACGPLRTVHGYRVSRYFAATLRAALRGSAICVGVPGAPVATGEAANTDTHLGSVQPVPACRPRRRPSRPNRRSRAGGPGMPITAAAMRAAAALVLLAAVAHAANAPGKTAGKRTPVKPPNGVVGLRQQEAVDPDLLSQVFTSTPPSFEREAGGGEAPLSQEFICSVFGGPSCPENTPPIDVPCQCENGEACQCVPYYQCDKSTGSFNEFGVGVIDIRQQTNTSSNSCPHYLYKCCKPSISKSPSDPPPSYGTDSSPEPAPHVPPTEPPPYLPLNEGPYNTPSPPEYQPSESPPPPYNPPTESSPSYQPTPEPGPAPGPAKCGIRNPEGIGVRITGDEDGEAQFGEFPWMVAILKVETDDDEKKRNLYQCGGALITPQIVITAAHCVKTSSPRQLKIRAGEWDTQTSKEMYRHQDVTVDEVAVHPDYYAGAVHFDVALLFLNDPVHLGYHIGTICMPEQNQNFDYNKCFVSGWGKDKFGQQGRYQVILKKLELPIVPNDECQEGLRKTRLGSHFILHHSFICAGGEEGKDTCKGDGGSPLVCPMPHDPTRYQLAGTVAWGIDCGLKGVPGVYGNVPLFRNWVDDQVRLHNIDSSSYLA